MLRNLTLLSLIHEIAQVLSFSVSRCLNVIVGPVASETSKFALTFDKFFDALNVCNFDSGKHERKPFKDPYRSGSDFRLKVCLAYNAMWNYTCLIIIVVVVGR